MKKFLLFVAIWLGWHIMTMLSAPLVRMMIESDLQASDVSSCGVKPHAPVQCLFCDAYCSCDSKGVCRWVWLKK